ncbi:FHA domain-containing protein [Microbacterium sp. USHLN186]|uniref:FHA domain-containing protein n=1 Tax=Microbacterium sp. USHLN186 TaxID=3081286 RepID=UPI00301B5C1D
MITVDADLTVALLGTDTEAPFSMKITGSGRHVNVFISDPERLPSVHRAQLHEFDALARQIAAQGLTVRIEGPQGPLVEVGDVRRSMLARLVTGSSHLRLGSLSALNSMRRIQSTRALPPIPGVAPAMLPLAPTFQRNRARRITTTHYAWGAGHPRLIFTVDAEQWDGIAPKVFDLTADQVTIGSSPTCDLVLPDLESVHAEIRHEKGDEYVLYAKGVVGGGAYRERIGDEEEGRILRTGALITMGSWRLAFFREEYADHGRPYGGRQGGEYSYQRPQPPREQLMREHGSTAGRGVRTEPGADPEQADGGGVAAVE